MRCLEKDRNRRYETANGLAEDIDRHLSDQPVEARRPTRIYRLKKFIRRNKVAFFATCGVMSALLIGFGLSTWMYLREREARAHSVFAEQKANKAATKSQQVAIELGNSQLKLGDVLSDFGRRGEAELVFDKAIKIFDAAAAEFPEVAFFRQEQAFSQFTLGRFLSSVGRNRGIRRPFPFCNPRLCGADKRFSHKFLLCAGRSECYFLVCHSFATQWLSRRSLKSVSKCGGA